MSSFQIPSEEISLPSKGHFYPLDSPLSSGKVEIKYMTAREEDILTNLTYIRNGTVIDKLLKALIVTPGVKYDDILIGDKNAIMVAARILAYGKDYPVVYKGEDYIVDLSQIKEKEVDFTNVERGKNEFIFNLPNTSNTVTFRLLTHLDEQNIDNEVEGLKKIDKESNRESSTRLKHIITSVNGDSSSKTVREFVDNGLLSVDARALRKEYARINPDVELVFYPDNTEEGVNIPLGTNFFYPSE
jgi:hypothetical protein